MSDVKVTLRDANGEVIAEEAEAVEPRRTSPVAAGPTRWATAQPSYPHLGKPNVPEDSEPERRPWMGQFNSLGGRSPASYD
jgi:hypothetical protein